MPRARDDDLLSAAEAAQLLGLSEAGAWRSRASRHGIEPDVRIDGRTPRWYRRTVLDSENLVGRPRGTKRSRPPA